MSRSSLFVDIGNSAVKWRTPDSVVFSQGVDFFTPNSLPKAEILWVSAVANLSIVDAIKETHANVKLVSSLRQHEKLTIAYEDPTTLGSDRFFAMLGAIKSFPEISLLIIDVGSAVTFDIIDHIGIHKGGLIMPGIASLRKSFPKFSTEDLTLKSVSIQSNTQKAWQSGTHAMLISAINAQIESFELSYPSGQVLISGGTVNEIIHELSKSIKPFDNLVLDGLESYSHSMG